MFDISHCSQEIYKAHLVAELNKLSQEGLVLNAPGKYFELEYDEDIQKECD